MIRALIVDRPRAELPRFTIHVEPLAAEWLKCRLWVGDESPVEIEVAGKAGWWLVLGVGVLRMATLTVRVEIVPWMPALGGFAEGLRRIGAAMGLAGA